MASSPRTASDGGRGDSGRDGRHARLLAVLDTAAAIVVIALGAACLWSLSARAFRAGPARPSATAPELPSARVPLTGVPLIGAPAAKAVIIEFEDFQCPFCGRAARDILPAVKRDYVDGGLAVLAFRNLPLSQIHHQAEQAALVGICSAAQGKFWELRLLFFADQRSLGPADLLRKAEKVGVRPDTLTACLAAPETRAALRADVELARSLKVTGTPTFLVGSREGDFVRVTSVLKGLVPVSEWQRVLAPLVGR